MKKLCSGLTLVTISWWQKRPKWSPRFVININPLFGTIKIFNLRISHVQHMHSVSVLVHPSSRDFNLFEFWFCSTFKLLKIRFWNSLNNLSWKKIKIQRVYESRDHLLFVLIILVLVHLHCLNWIKVGISISFKWIKIGK